MKVEALKVTCSTSELCIDAGTQGVSGTSQAGRGVDHATARLAVQAAAGALMQMSKCKDIVMWYDSLPQVSS